MYRYLFKFLYLIGIWRTSVKKKKEIFSIEKEAEKLNMSVGEYRQKVLKEVPKGTLDDIYDMNELTLREIEKDKIKFNQEVMNSDERKMDFIELENFMNSLY